MIVTLIRHTSVNVEPGICYGQSDVDVSTNFEVEAKNIIEKLQNKTFDAVYCSPLQRCQKLASYCGFSNLKIDNRLMEMNFGTWEMQAWDKITDPQLQYWFENWVDEIPTHGESFRNLLSRSYFFLNDLQELNYQHIAIFTHAGVIRSIGVLSNKFTLEKAFDFVIQYGDVVELFVE